MPTRIQAPRLLLAGSLSGFAVSVIYMREQENQFIARAWERERAHGRHGLLQGLDVMQVEQADKFSDRRQIGGIDCDHLDVEDDLKR